MRAPSLKRHESCRIGTDTRQSHTAAPSKPACYRVALVTSANVSFLCACVLLTVPVRLDPDSTTSYLQFGNHTEPRRLGRVLALRAE